MKFRVTIKDSDMIYHAMEELPEEMTEEQREDAKSLMHEWFEYGEYVDIEFDTETRKATLIKNH